MSNLIAKARGVITDFFSYWDKPPKGRYIPNKEAAAYCIGGMGVSGASVLPSYLTAGAGMYIAVALHMKTDDIILAGFISTIISLLRSPFMGWLVDNVHSKKYGKFHPYLVWMPIPIIISAFALGWIPYMLLENSYSQMFISYLVIFNLLQLFMALYGTGFSMTVQVISPSPEERTWLMSVGAFVYSLGPSITNAVIPLAANLMFSKEGIGADGQVITIAGLNDIRTSQWIVPIFLAVFCGIGYLIAFKTKERTVVAREYKQRVNFMEGFKLTVSNKYFWLMNISGILSVFKMASTWYVGWICTYIYQNSWSQALFVSIIGFANVPGMLLAPVLIKKFGTRNVLVASNVLMVLMTLPMIFFMNSPLFLLIMTFMVTLVYGVQVVTGPVMNSQLFDFQQYKSGDRLEGFLSQIGGIIGTLGTLGTTFVGPYVCKVFGYIDDASVLYNMEILHPIMRTMFIIGIVSGVLGTLPMLLWNITEKRHHQIMDVLRVRADSKDGLVDKWDAKKLEERIESGEADVMAYRAAFEQQESQE